VVNQSKKGFVIFGSDRVFKKQRIDAVRGEFYAGSLPQDSIDVYPDAIDLRSLEDTLTMISFQGKRMVVFKNAEGLRAPAKEYLTAFIAKRLSLFDIFLLFEYEESDSDSPRRDAFVTMLKNVFPSQRCPMPQGSSPATFSHLFAALRSKRRSAALRVTEEMLKEKEAEVAPQIMGVLVNFVHNSALPGKERMLYHLWKTDRVIKTGAGSPRTVISLCLIKLFKDYLR